MDNLKTETKRESKSRYSRQIILEEIGENGQQKLEKATVAIVGIGALGTVAAELLARAGIGHLIVIDRDIIEETNLQRQSLFSEKDVRRSKAVVAAERIKEINSKCKTTISAIHLSQNNINTLNTADLILDCTDNQQTRFLINDYCKKNKKLWIYAAAIKTEGYVMPMFPEQACLRCFMKEAELETCATAGVLGTTTAAIAALQATLAIKMILNKPVEQKLLHINIWNNNFKSLTIKQSENCLTCHGIYEYLSRTEDSAMTIKFCSTQRFQIKGKAKDFPTIIKRWEKIDVVEADAETIRFKNIVLFKDGRALIKAATAEEALSVYSEWVGN